MVLTICRPCDKHFTGNLEVCVTLLSNRGGNLGSEKKLSNLPDVTLVISVPNSNSGLPTSKTHALIFTLLHLFAYIKEISKNISPIF